MPISFSVSFLESLQEWHAVLRRFLSISSYFLRQSLTSLPRLALNLEDGRLAASGQPRFFFSFFFFFGCCFVLMCLLKKMAISSFYLLSGAGDIIHYLFILFIEWSWRYNSLTRVLPSHFRIPRFGF